VLLSSVYGKFRLKKRNKKMKRVLFFFIPALLIISGCTNMFGTRCWYQEGKSLEECQQDWKDCDEGAKQMADAEWRQYKGNLTAQLYRRASLRSEYMVAKGYRFVPDERLPKGIRRTQEQGINLAGK